MQRNEESFNNLVFSDLSTAESKLATSTALASSQASSVTTSSASLLPSLAPPHHPHYPHYSAASQSPYSASPFSVSSLTSPSNYSAAAAMNSYHQNLMGTSHLTGSFMEPPHMPVPVSPLYSYQQHPPAGYTGYPPPPTAIHMPSPNYPYYANGGYTQPPASSYHMFDRIKPDIGYGGF